MAGMTIISTVKTSEVHSAVANAAARSGVDFGYLLNQAKIESSLDPKAQASTSSAAGLFQFTKQTWLRTLKAHGAEHGLAWAADAISTTAHGHAYVGDPSVRESIMNLRFDANASSAMAGEMAADNRAALEAGLGRPAEPVDLYLAHFLGSEGALKFLTANDADPSQAAAPLFPQAAAANRAVFYDANGAPRSLGDIRTRFAAKIGQSAPGMTSVSTIASSEASRPTAERLANFSGFEAMPERLSVDFAQAAYQRLAALTEAGR